MSKVQIGVLALAVLCTASAEPRYIGVVSAEGSSWVDSAGVSDHATVFEGSTVETTDAPAPVQIGNAVRVLPLFPVEPPSQIIPISAFTISAPMPIGIIYFQPMFMS